MVDPSISKKPINTDWRILIIDDDEDDFLIARDMLRDAKGRKIDVHWVSTYEAGKQELKSNHYDAVLVDYDIGSHTGIDLIREATERRYTSPLILFTGRGSYEIDLEAMQAGATLYLTKNEVTPLTLERFIRYAIERKRIERERSDILESIQDGFYSIDRRWAITFISRQAAESAGFEPAAVIGRNVWEVFPELLDTPAMRYYHVVMESQQMMKFETQGARQGSWYTVSVYPSIDGISVFWQDITEQKRAEEKMAYQASLLDNIHDAIIANDANQRITAWNKAAEKLYGYTAEEAIGKIHGELLHSELTFEQRAVLLEQLNTHGEYTVETIQYTKSGRRLMIEGKILARRDIHGKITGYVNANRDISDRKQAEAELIKSEATLRESSQAHQESEARLREFLESTHNNYIALDHDWCFTYANRHYGETMGIDPRELVGKNYWEVFPQYVGTELEQKYRKVMAERVPLQYQQGGIYTNNMYEMSVYPSREGIAIFSIDRTEEIRHQQQIEDERARLETILQALPVGVWISDANGQIVGSNEQANRIWAGNATGVEPADHFERHHFWNVQSGELLQPENYPLRRALRTRQPIAPVEYRIQRLDGSTGYVLVSATPIKDSGDRLTGAVAINLDITERKEAENSLHRYSEALERSEEKFALSFRSSPVAIAISTVNDGRFIEVNHRYTELFGFSRDELVGHTSIELGIFPNPEDRKEIARMFWEGHGFRSYEVRLLTKSGQPRDVLFSTEAIEVDGQECMLSLVIDITERKRAETAIRESENKYQAVFQSAPFSIVLSRLSDGLIVDVNPAWQQLFGVTKEEAVGKTSLELGTAPDAETRARGYAEMRETGHLSNFEMKFRTRAGKEFIGQNNAELIEIDGVRYLLAVTEDITERKQAEEALRASEQEQRALASALEVERAALKESIERERARAAEMEILMDTVPAMIWISHDPQCREMTGNRYGYEFLNMWQNANISKTAPEAEVRQQPYRNFKDGREIPTEELPMQVAAATGQPASNFDFDLVFNNGTVRTVLGNVNPLFDEHGRPSGAVAAFMDITDRRDVEEQLKHYAQELERSNQALQEFAFIASHDLQEPLRKIIMFGDSLQRQLGGMNDQTALDYLNRMQSAAARMQAMVKGLLELSRVNTHAGSFIAVNLKQLAEEVVSDLEARIQATGGQVLIGDLPTVEADALQMRQLFQNLIGNAIKFHQPDVPPIVRVSGIAIRSRKASTAEIRVEDNGIGFEQQYAERIFQPFQRLHGRNEYEGTGLGLAICQKIIERHHGTITAQSALGKGTTFLIRLPLEQN